MKRLLLLLLSSFLLFKSNAQDHLKKFNPGLNHRFYVPLFKEQRQMQVNRDSSIVLNNLSLLRDRKPGVYRLPQDNMPCIVPDSSKTVRMPNAWKGPLRVPYNSNPPRIPNYAKPPQNS